MKYQFAVVSVLLVLAKFSVAVKDNDESGLADNDSFKNGDDKSNSDEKTATAEGETTETEKVAADDPNVSDVVEQSGQDSSVITKRSMDASQDDVSDILPSISKTDVSKQSDEKTGEDKVETKSEDESKRDDSEKLENTRRSEQTETDKSGNSEKTVVDSENKSASSENISQAQDDRAVEVNEDHSEKNDANQDTRRHGNDETELAKHSAALARTGTSDEKGTREVSHDRTNGERLGYSESHEHVPYQPPFDFGSLDKAHQASDSPYHLLSALGSGRGYQRDLISPLQSPHLPSLSNPLLHNPNMFNLQAHQPPPYLNRNTEPVPPRRSYASNDELAVQHYDPFSNSYPLSPNAESPRQPSPSYRHFQTTTQSSRVQNQYSSLPMYQSYSAVKHPLFFDRQRRNTNAQVAVANPFIGYFKGLFDNFRMTQ